MNDANKTKEELLVELQELKQAHNSLKVSFDKGLDKEKEEKRMLEKLINVSEDFIQFSDSNRYDKILQIILDVSGATYAVLNIFDDNGLDFTTVAFAGMNENIKKVSSLLGFSVINKHWGRDIVREEKTKQNTITRFEHLYELAGNVISKNIIHSIEKVFGIEEVFVVKTTKNNLVLGDFTLLFKTGETLTNPSLVDLYAHQVVLFLDRNKMTNSLHESEKQHRLLIENSHDIIYTLTTEGVFEYVSPAWTTLLGHPVSEVSGKSFSQFVHPDDLPECFDFIEKIVSTGLRQAGVEYRVQDTNGNWHWHTSSAVPLRDEGGTVIGFEGTARDITERKRAEQKLIESEEKYRLIFEFSPLGILSFDEKAVITACNENFVKIIGSSREKLIGINMLSLPDKNLVSLVQNALNGSSDFFEGVYSSTTANKITPISCFFAPMNVGGGSITGGVGIIEDITDRKQAEAKLKKSEENFRTFFDSIADLLFVLDTNGNMIDVNQTVIRRLEYTKEELIGQSVLVVHPEDKREEARQIVGEMLAGVKDFCPIPVVSKSGIEIQVETRVYQGIWDGEPALYGVVKDVTKMKQSEEKFSKAFQSGSNLMAISTISTGRYIEVNDLFLEVMEFTKDELIGKTALELNLFEDMHQREIIKSTIKEIGFVNNVEVKIKTKTGKPLIGLFSGILISIGDEPCLLTTMIDITEKKMDEEKLAKVLSETENMNRLMTGREERILELKLDINNLLRQMGKDIKYKSVEE